MQKFIRVILIWLDSEIIPINREYLLKCGANTIPARILTVNYKIDIIGERQALSDKIQENNIICCDILTMDNMVFCSFEQNKTLGSFILIDRLTNMTAACGTIISDGNFINQTEEVRDYREVTRDLRARQKFQNPITIWLTGLSGAGKSTLAKEIERKLYTMGKHSILLDGDNIRLGLCNDLGFCQQDRCENIRRVAEVSKIMNDAGIIVIVASISPSIDDRENAKKIIGKESFIEVYVSTPLDVCKYRDVKGLYRKAMQGEISEFTGISAIYEQPIKPNIEIDTSKMCLEESVEYIMSQIKALL